jgi:hypothetical protein
MLKHNKRKNTAIVLEQLLTLATRLATQKKADEFDFVVNLTKRFFGPNTNIGKEKKVLRSITESVTTKDVDCDSVINEALKEASLIDSAMLEKEKVALINEINSKIGDVFFKIPVKDYKVLASAQILVNESRSNSYSTTPEERVQIKAILKENMAPKQKEPELEVDNVTYKILINKFNEKYGPLVNENQKAILSSWIKFLVTSNDSEIVPLLNEKLDVVRRTVKKSLREKSAKAMDYYELLKESDEKLKDAKIETATEENVYEVMRYFDLVNDLEKKE